jgi:Txe/YoeB family toxin of Txe-Axe toxin-antitoxin module
MEMKNTYEYKTTRGASVKVTIEEVKEELENDGIKFNGKPELKVTEFVLNGKAFDAKIGSCQYVGLLTFKFNGKDAAVEQSEEIKADIKEYYSSKIKAAFKADDEYREHVAMVNRAMNK